MAKAASAEPALFDTMDGARGIGACFVVMSHSLLFWGSMPLAQQIAPYLVDLFFILSGFVIAFAFEDKIKSGMTPVSFMLRRFIRLYPLYVFGSLMGLAVHFALIVDWRHIDWGRQALELIPPIFFVPSLDPDSPVLYTLDRPAWSLLHELVINGLYVVLLPKLTTRRLFMLVIAFAVLLALSVYIYGDIHRGWAWKHLWSGFARSGFGFFGGVLMWRLLGSRKKPPRQRSWTTFVPIFICCLPVLITAPMNEIGLIQLTFAFFVGPIMVWSAQRVQPPKFLVPLFALGGTLSYGIYIVHYPLLEIVEHVTANRPELVATYGASIGAGILAAATAVAYVAERYFDRPVRRWMNEKLKMYERWRKAKAAATAVAGLHAE